MPISTTNIPSAKLISRSDITEELMVIKIRSEDVSFDFKPGQYCTVGKNGIERAYSIASAPHQDYLELFIELVPDGALTPKLWNLKLGDSLSLRPRAKGIFTMNKEVHNHVMIGTVTGIVPYISILRSYVHEHRQGHKFYVFLGASYQDELTYDKELQLLSQQYQESIFFIPTISRPEEERNIGWVGAKGRVNDIYESYIDELDLPKEDILIYTCGHPGMIEDVKSKAILKGWNFIEERFWKE
jgi:ferredoxin--NADP+ reductase